jgi:glycerol-3-phosphate dehydrogenase
MKHSITSEPPSPLPAKCDVLIVGGGINGAGIARDLAGQGLKVVLCEKDDLASHTSSSSSKLIHGGLRYLEYGEFGLVRKALAEREVLIRNAPHIMWPLRFVMPHNPSMRPAWMVRLGLFLYDHLARRNLLPSSTNIDLRSHIAGQALQPHFHRGFMYSDGWVDDARLVLLNALDAHERGAHILPGWQCMQAQRGRKHWQVTLRSCRDVPHQITAGALVNATGPWASRFLSHCLQLPQPKSLRLVKGSHIVVPQLFDHGHAYLFQNPDKRIIFALPYEGKFTLIGTTDIELTGELETAQTDCAEIDYLCTQASRYFAKPVQPSDVVWSYCGVRPLLSDPSSDPAAVTRDYELELDAPANRAPLLTIWGGKITTYRKLAEDAVHALSPALQFTPQKWTDHAPLPGGDFQSFGAFLAATQQRYPELPTPLLSRWGHAYGTRISTLMNEADGQLGLEIAPGLFEAELHYLHRHEWVRTADDVLWRRSKLGLHLTKEQREAVAVWCLNCCASTAAHQKCRPTQSCD